MKPNIPFNHKRKRDPEYHLRAALTAIRDPTESNLYKATTHINYALLIITNQHTRKETHS